MKAETKYRGSLKFSAIGDALGWITEFEKERTNLMKKYGVELVDRFHDWKKNVGGRFLGFTDNISGGSYSDDTQLMLAVARSIGKNGEVDNEYFSKIELYNWLEYARGGGRTVKVAAEKISRRSARWNSNFYSFKVNGELIDYRQSGANGAAMRVLPIALANLGNFEKIKHEIFCNSIVTHGHPRAILGAVLYGYALNEIIVYRPDDFTWENYLTKIGTDISRNFDIDLNSSEEIREWTRLWNKGGENFQKLLSKTIIEAQEQLRYVYQSLKRNVAVDQVFRTLGCFDNASKGSGVVTVIAGIFITAKFHDSPTQGIIEAVNQLGSDTDSIAAFAGGLLGALHGSTAIPTKWKSVQDSEYLDQISDRLLAISEGTWEDLSPPIESKGKNINDIKVDDFAIDNRVSFVPLGNGTVTSVQHQPTLTKGKYNLILDVTFDVGQTVRIAHLFSSPESQVRSVSVSETFMEKARHVLSKSAFDKLESYIKKHKKVPDELVELLQILIDDLSHDKD